ncbi:glutathione S-transferase [Xanthobacter dioxanivorans]|uniref:Glutathione S-transferase n=1 Tax=Xanthobacter dioxanivorans TaxID=2528964 RepID=A0A974PQI0_9HYPH|nr:glutathione S-transferase [Xanthobacter dioxanivorans]QRG07533.1 glutathione S-transferase [Xanthobacter dioxanivorans]
MKLYDAGRAPNPRRVRIFLAEKGISVPLEPVDLARMEHKSDAFTGINPRQRVPVLVLDDGTAIAETMAICRYFEALQPEPNLFGRTPVEQALVEMWQRRVELDLFFPVMTVLRHLNPGMAGMEVPQVPDWGEANKPKVLAALAFFNDALADRAYAAGERFSVADITLLVAVDFMRVIRTEVPASHTHLLRWHDVVSQRPSAKA